VHAQVFFYGVFVLVGQVLNSRERFGPMMWAPIVNNVVACAALGTYAAIWGTSDGSGGFTTAQEVLLGASATLGIAIQTLVLVPTHGRRASPSGSAATCAASGSAARCGWVPGRSDS
jgi:peptidoglycan biosynthesis protein MviN/MurJ (putative lipid II flippase)